MRCVLAGLLVGFALLPAAGRAENTAVHACDLAAARPATSTELVGPQAVAACQAALAADPENPRLLFEMGRVAQSNNDDNQARAFYERAAAHGYARAQNNLALFYAEGRAGLKKNDREAVQLFKLAAAQGDANAQAGLGFFYENGRGGLPKDDEEAMRLFKLAAEHGSTWAQTRLGGSLGAGGVPVPLDWANAFREHLRKYWNLPRSVDASSNLRVVLLIKLNSDGRLSQAPTVVEGTAAPAGAEFAQSAAKALERAQPFTMLKAENYNQWKEMQLVFDSRMFANAGQGGAVDGGRMTDATGTEGPH